MMTKELQALANRLAGATVSGPAGGRVPLFPDPVRKRCLRCLGDGQVGIARLRTCSNCQGRGWTATLYGWEEAAAGAAVKLTTFDMEWLEYRKQWRCRVQFLGASSQKVEAGPPTEARLLALEAAVRALPGVEMDRPISEFRAAVQRGVADSKAGRVKPWSEVRAGLEKSPGVEMGE